jgi:autotransporter-associated beta strand protein
MRRPILFAATILILLLAARTTSAITNTWMPPASSVPAAMSNPAHWSGGAPISGSAELTLIFPGSALNHRVQQDIASPLSVQRLEFDLTSQAGNPYRMTGSPFQLNNLGSAPSIDVDHGMTVDFESNLMIDAPTSITLTGSGRLNLHSVSGDEALSIAGMSSPFQRSQVTVSNANPSIAFNGISGFVIVNATGTRVSGSGGTLVVFDGGTLRLDQLVDGTDITVRNTGEIELSGGVVVDDVDVSGTIELMSANAVLKVQGSITNNGHGSISGPQGTFDLDGQFKAINTLGSNPEQMLQIGARIINGRINKIGPGTLRLSNPMSSFTGQNVVNEGILRGPANALGNVLNNATVYVDSGDLTSNFISGPGHVLVGNVTFSAPQSHTGGTTVLVAARGNSNTLVGNFTTVPGDSGYLEIRQDFDGTFSGNLAGNLSVQKYGTGVLSLSGTSTTNAPIYLHGGGLRLLTDAAIGNGRLEVWSFPSSSDQTLEAVGSRTFANPLNIREGVTFVGSGNFNFTGAGPQSLSGPLTHNSSGSTTINGKFDVAVNGSVVVNAGSLTLGDPTVVNGFSSAVPIRVNGGTLGVRSLNFVKLPHVILAGGTLSAPDGYAIPIGAVLEGSGTVAGRLASENGSSIFARANLSLGDAASVAGVNLDGELYTNQHTVRLVDANPAVLGSLTDLGTATQNGTLASDHGYVLNFGRNITGRGRIQSNNAITDAATINGHVRGDSATNYLEFTGYVKGVGTFDNVAFSGTFSPGLSPTLLTTGSVTFTPSNLLEIEIGGLIRGSQYDAFDFTDLATLGGTLQITLIDAFSPSSGNQFLLFQGPQTGTFSAMDLPSLSAGLTWDTSRLYSSGMIEVVAIPEQATFVQLAVALTAFPWRRRLFPA